MTLFIYTKSLDFLQRAFHFPILRKDFYGGISIIIGSVMCWSYKVFFPLTRISKFIVIARELDTNEAFSPRSSRVDCARASHTRLTRQHIM